MANKGEHAGKNAIIFCFVVCLFFAGCAGTPVVSLRTQCPELEKYGTVRAEVTLWDNISSGFLGLLGGTLAGFGLGMAVTSGGANQDNVAAANILATTSVIAGAIIGWNLPRGRVLNQDEFDRDQMLKDCRDFKIYEEKKQAFDRAAAYPGAEPAVVKQEEFGQSTPARVLFAVLGSTAGLIGGGALGMAAMYSSHNLTTGGAVAVVLIFAGSIGGGIFGWNGPEIFGGGNREEKMKQAMNEAPAGASESAAIRLDNAIKLLSGRKFFKTPRRLAETQAELNKNGYYYSDESLLDAMQKAEYLNMTEENGEYQFEENPGLPAQTTAGNKKQGLKKSFSTRDYAPFLNSKAQKYIKISRTASPAPGNPDK